MLLMNIALAHRFRNNKDALGFTLFACIFSAAFLGLYFSLPRIVLHPFEIITAQVVTVFLHGLGTNVACHGNVVSSPSFSVRVIEECLGIEILLLAAAFILAYPATWKHKLTAAAIGFPILLMTNVLRMVLLFLVSSINNAWFNYAHIFFGQFMILFVVVFLYLSWILSMNTNHSIHARRWFLIRLLLSSSAFFLLWSFLQKPYVAMSEDLLTIIAEAIMRLPSRFNEKATYDYTFGIATFLSLLFAERGIPLSRRLIPSFVGICILFLIHLLFRTLAILAFAQRADLPYYMSIAVYAFSTVLLPLLLWLALRKLGRTQTNCPFCGKAKICMLDHIRNKHGEEALKKCSSKGLIVTNGNEAGFL